MNDISIAAQNAINDELLRRFGATAPDGHRLSWIAVDKLDEAQAYGRDLEDRAEAIRDGVEVLRVNRNRQALMIAELIQLHPVELDEIAMRIGQAIAIKDPSGLDGRYSSALQALAAPFRR